MLRLGILGLGAVAAMLITDCGARTPVEDEDLFGSPSSNGHLGSSSSGPGTGGSINTSPTGGSGSGVSGSSAIGFGGTGIAGAPGVAGSVGSGGTPIGMAGAPGSAGSPGVGGSVGTGGGPIGMGGATGVGGTVGTGGAPGGAGGGPGPNPVRRLVNDLPGTRNTQDCIACASMCQGSEQCAANPVCAAGIECAVATCGTRGPNPGGACLLKCVGGDPQAFAQAVTALLCVYGTCGRSCTNGRMR
jgi:hypothetical protein